VLEVETQRLRPSQALETLSAHCGQGKEVRMKNRTLLKLRKLRNLVWISAPILVIFLVQIFFSCAPTPVVVQKPSTLPFSYIIDKVPQFYHDTTECGPTALAMVLNYYGVKKKKEELRDDLRWDPKLGVSPQKMLSFPFKKYGFKIDFIKEGSIEKVMEYITQNNPVIVRQWINYDAKLKGDAGHWRVVIGYDHEKQRIYMRDPSRRGSSSISYKQFLDLWDLSNHKNPSKNWMIAIMQD